MDHAPHYHPLVKTVARDLRHRCGVPAGARLVVAVSGGADSTALLRALALLAPRRGFNLDLHVAHIHHHLRPEPEPSADAAFVEQLAAQLGLPCHIRHIRPALAAGNRAAAARRLRYATLLELAREVDARFIVTAHHGDDQLETVLMRLLRGSGVRGMAAMRWRRRLTGDRQPPPVHLVRPMLGLTRSEVERWLSHLEQPWREDRTNADTTSLRNALRQRITPALGQLAHDVAAKAVAMADRAAEATHLMDRAARRIARRISLETHPDRRILDRAAARRVAAPWLGLALRWIVGEMGIATDRWPGRAVDRAVRAIRDDRGGVRCLGLPGGYELRIEGGKVIIAAMDAPR